MCEYETVELNEEEWDYKLLLRAADGTCRSDVFYYFKGKNVEFEVASISRVKLRSNIETTSDPVNPNLMMFHGTHVLNVKEILKHGFRIPAKASHGRRFGKAVYLTPSSAYALRFCFTDEMKDDFENEPDGTHKVKILVCTIAAQLSDMLTYDLKNKQNKKRNKIKEEGSGVIRFKERFSPSDLNFKYDSIGRLINVGPIEDRGLYACTNAKLQYKVDEYCVYNPKDVVPSYVIEYEVSWGPDENLYIKNLFRNG